jgi:hypothetical protein
VNGVPISLTLSGSRAKWRKAVHQGMLDQRHVIRFLVNEGISREEIPHCLLNVYDEAAMKESEVFWVGAV